MNLAVKDLKRHCRHFRGDVPCAPHKQHAVHCLDETGNDCRYYEPVDKKILIIKLGALGDVIRTTPLLRKLKVVEPRAEIWWLTRAPEVVPAEAHVILPLTAESVVTLRATTFDAIFNLDKDKEACALCATLTARVKRGFTLQNGKAAPVDSAAEHKFLTGVFDDLSKANTKSYQQEIFEICGFTFDGEEYILPAVVEQKWKLPGRKKIVGLNTGCGDRWTSRLWPDDYWLALAKRLKKAGYAPLLLGGEQEHKKNLRLAKISGASYLGHFPLKKFMAEMSRCDLIVTAVTMAMHLAIGLSKKIVLFNNIFNRHEFELYGRGEILEPDFSCTCYYSPTCPNNCMQYLSVEKVFAACARLLDPSKPSP
jgi:heptosyltransferase-2